MRTIPAIRSILLLAAFYSVLATPAAAQVDLSGEWAGRIHEEAIARRLGQSMGDWAGIPLSAAARVRAESWDASIVSLKEHQDGLYTSFLAFYAPGNARISKIVDGRSQRLVAYAFEYSLFPLTRTIWMDGRAHPPEYAAHTWAGFSTGAWQGRVLKVETTHLKAGYVARNGVRHTDRARMVEYLVRHGDYLTVVSILEDPSSLDEPFVQSWNFQLNPDQQFPPRQLSSVFQEVAGHPKGYVPHYLPGLNPYLTEFATRSGIPFSALRGGKETAYPEFASTLQHVRTKPVATGSN